MKKTILILFAMLTVSAAAQDFEPTQHPFTFKGINPYYLSADSSYFTFCQLLQLTVTDLNTKLSLIPEH